MSKMYGNQKTGVQVVSGPIKSVADDGLSAVITVQKYNKDTRKNEPEDVTVKTQLKIEEVPGSIVTAVGYKVRGVIEADVLSSENIYVEEAGLSVLSGQVLFANKNDEIDKETGSPRLNQAGQPKKPHFDITIAVGDGNERVTHTVNIYNFPEKVENGVVVRAAQDNIGRYEKLFATFDRETNPVYAAIVTQPGNSWVAHSKSSDGRVWDNQRMSHLGANSLDVSFLNGFQKGNTAPAQEAATTAPSPAQEVATPEAATKADIPNGFDAGDYSLDGLDEDFTLE